MSDVDKMYYNSTEEFKLFGIKFFEKTFTSNRFDGKGEFINETIPNERYFEMEFRNHEHKNNKR